MKMIDLPHKVCDYTCPTNGIEDQYEWKTGQRLPDYLLFYIGFTGFSYVKQIRAEAPRMVFWGGRMGKPMHEILSGVMGYTWENWEGGSFQHALDQAKQKVNLGLPVILGQLDMYHLPYFHRFYHQTHIPQHFVLMVGYDEARGGIYIQDNSRADVQFIPYEDLKLAWDVTLPGVNRKNSAYCLHFKDNAPGIPEIIQKGFHRRAETFLNPEAGFLGIKGIKKLSTDFPRWKQELSEPQYLESLRHLATFTCSVLPMPPQRLLNFPLNIQDSHQAMRDLLAKDLRCWADLYHIPAYLQAAEHFAASGSHIQELTETVCDVLLGQDTGLKNIPNLIQTIANEEQAGFTDLLN